jgi:rhodanese-related sulfurtransferase
MLRSRLGEVPRDKEFVTFCKVSLRGYKAARLLQAAGFQNVRVMDGGITAWPYDKLQG